MTTKVHRVRFYNPKPESVNCIAFNKKSKQLALARSDASIEIWDLSFAPFCLKFIPGVENGSVEALAWSNNRLLSTGLGGALVEWDLDNLSLKSTVLLTGYAAWCLDVNSENTLVAVGTEQGYLNLYSLENDEIVYEKLFDKQEGRIMCCKFDKTGNILVTGSVDTIRVWNVLTGHATTRISVKRRGQETIVWSLAVLSDNTIVSGDSYGRLTFWDALMGDQIESFVTHKADILAIAVDDDEKRIYCSGVDPVVMSFIKVNKPEKQCGWMKHVQRNMHEHDVRALAVKGKTLISLGVDGYITLSSFAPKWVMRIPPMVPAPRSSVSPQKKLLLLRYKNHIEVWKLGEYTSKNGELVFTDVKQQKPQPTQEEKSNLEEDTDLAVVNNAKQTDEQNQTLKISENPVKLVSIQTKHNRQVLCCEISPCGEFIAYATDECLRILRLEFDEQYNTSLSKVLVSGVAGCTRLRWASDTRALATAAAGRLSVLRLDASDASVVYTVDTEKYLKAKSILHLLYPARTASNEQYLIAGDTLGNIAIWRQNDRKFEHYATLPTYRCVPCAITVDSESELMVVVYVDQKMVEYSLSARRLRDVSARLGSAWAARRTALADIALHANGTRVAADHTAVWLLREHAPAEQDEPQTKKPHTENGIEDTSLRIIPVKYLSGLHWLSPQEAVFVETPAQDIVDQLPAPVSRSKWL